MIKIEIVVIGADMNLVGGFDVYSMAFQKS